MTTVSPTTIASSPYRSVVDAASQVYLNAVSRTQQNLADLPANPTLDEFRSATSPLGDGLLDVGSDLKGIGAAGSAVGTDNVNVATDIAYLEIDLGFPNSANFDAHLKKLTTDLDTLRQDVGLDPLTIPASS